MTEVTLMVALVALIAIPSTRMLGIDLGSNIVCSGLEMDEYLPDSLRAGPNNTPFKYSTPGMSIYAEASKDCMRGPAEFQAEGPCNGDYDTCNAHEGI